MMGFILTNVIVECGFAKQIFLDVNFELCDWVSGSPKKSILAFWCTFTQLFQEHFKLELSFLILSNLFQRFEFVSNLII